MSDPTLDQWRLLSINVLVGRVTNHPLLRDGWIVTSEVQEMSRAAKRARTRSRWYDLLTEIPPDQPLPREACELLLSVFARRLGGGADIPDIKRLFDLVEEMTKPPGKPQ